LGDWTKRFYDLLKGLGFESIHEFLQTCPGLTYFDIANKFNNEIAPIQIKELQIQEAIRSGTVRDAAVDSLTRIMRHHMKKGWRSSQIRKHEGMSVFSTWVQPLQMLAGINSVDFPLAVWQALQQEKPPEGWCPVNSSDPILEAAFKKGWPQ
jgi:hypothetical protein